MMTLNIKHVDINLQCDSVDISQNMPTTFLEDYSIVSRKHLEKIINNSERCLTEDEHRWLIKRDCKKVISDIKKYTRGMELKNIIREENCMKVPIYGDQYVLNNGCFYYKIIPNNRILNVNSKINAIDGENDINVIVENNFTIINVQQLNININDNRNESAKFDFDNIVRGEKYNNSHVLIMDLERIYWDKWRNYIKKKKSVRTNNSNNNNNKKCDKIDSFLLKIQEKLNINQLKSIKHTKSSNHIVPKQVKTCYDRQQVKIENQKKLLDKQQKEIERLKLQQLKLESEKAMLENQNLLDLTYNRSEKSVKIKNVPRKVSAIVKARPSDILNRMEIRALDRQAKWEAIKDRRRKMEQEEQRKKQEFKEKCLKEQMEQKRKQLFEARENLRIKRIGELKKKVEREIWQENIKIADNYHRKLLLRKGLESFKVNLKNVRSQMQKAAVYYDKKMLAICICKWQSFANNISNEKKLFADQFYNRKLKKTAFLGFYKILEETKKKEQVAEDWNNFKIQEFYFKQWHNYVKDINIVTHTKMLKAESYHNRLILKHCFNNWKMYPEIVYKERLKDCRLRMWHEKVQEILPDFIPPVI